MRSCGWRRTRVQAGFDRETRRMRGNECDARVFADRVVCQHPPSVILDVGLFVPVSVGEDAPLLLAD